MRGEVLEIYDLCCRRNEGRSQIARHLDLPCFLILLSDSNLDFKTCILLTFSFSFRSLTAFLVKKKEDTK